MIFNNNNNDIYNTIITLIKFRVFFLQQCPKNLLVNYFFLTKQNMTNLFPLYITFFEMDTFHGC